MQEIDAWVILPPSSSPSPPSSRAVFTTPSVNTYAYYHHHHHHHRHHPMARRTTTALRTSDLCAKRANRKVVSSEEKYEDDNHGNHDNQEQERSQQSSISLSDNENDNTLKDDLSSPPLATTTGLPTNYQDVGGSIISAACATVAGERRADSVGIEWRGDRIIVTLHGEDIYLSAIDVDDHAVEMVDDDDDDDDEEEDDDDDFTVDGGITSLDGGDDDSDDTVPEDWIDVTTVARAINAALDCTEIGRAIAETHSIEVTTPGVASDEIRGDRMFAAYKGFDVTVSYDDPKKKDKKKKITTTTTIQGRLVERTEDHVVINVKGRMTKLVRENVVSVKLPKAKYEN